VKAAEAMAFVSLYLLEVIIHQWNFIITFLPFKNVV